MHDKNGDSEMPQDFTSRHWRMLGHRGAAVYRLLARIDVSVTLWLNRAVRSSRLADSVGIAAVRLAAVEVVLMVILALSGRRQSALRMLLSVGMVYVATALLGVVMPRQRPFHLEGVVSLAEHKPGRSFPSRHVASGLAMAAVGGREHPKLGQLMALLAWTLGVSRVAAGLHYPSDVLAGALLGRVIGRLFSPSDRRT